MKRFKLVVLVGWATVFFIAGMVFAQGQGGQGAPGPKCQNRFDAMDTNHNGELTKEEFMAASHARRNPEQVFKALDLSGRGYITKDEFCSGKGMGRGGSGKGMGKSQGTGNQ
jgi:hypothetical protein